MKTTLIALATAAGLGFAGRALAPAAAAPLAPAPLGFAVQESGTQVKQVRHIRRHVRRDFRRHMRRHHAGRPHLRRHFWAAAPWAHHNCFRVGRGFICYY